MVYAATSLSGAFYLFYSNKLDDPEKKEAFDRSYGAFLFISGLVAIYLALNMITTWPIDIPNTPLYLYNQQFGEPYLMFGIIATASGYALYHKYDVRPITYFAFVVGIFLLRYGINFLQFGLTRVLPLAATIYLTAALGALISVFWAHLSEDKPTKMYLGYLLILLLFISGATTLFVGFTAVEGHVTEALAR